MGDLLPFRRAPKHNCSDAVRRQSAGVIEIWPSDEDGGSWAVFHRSRGGDSLGHVGTFFAFDRAEEAARQAAAHYGATLDLGVPFA